MTSAANRWRSVREAHRRYLVPQESRAEAQLEPPAGEEVDAGGRFCDERGRAQRHVEDVRRDVNTAGAGRSPVHQRPDVEVFRPVGVVLEHDEVVSPLLAEHGEFDRAKGRGAEGSGNVAN